MPPAMRPRVSGARAGRLLLAALSVLVGGGCFLALGPAGFRPAPRTARALPRAPGQGALGLGETSAGRGGFLPGTSEGLFDGGPTLRPAFTMYPDDPDDGEEAVTAPCACPPESGEAPAAWEARGEPRPSARWDFIRGGPTANLPFVPPVG